MTEIKRQEHLGNLSRDFALFLPAISNFYNTFVSKQRVTEEFCSSKEREHLIRMVLVLMGAILSSNNDN